ncbi:hypothetical protein [Pseudomonas putida]|uniref:hypothetical protein n=1 Tax=Pseudomonas putida TaxID=303 RepID=UPI0015FC62B5|nr:hypothetical protein [Pseudomonas putida]
MAGQMIVLPGVTAAAGAGAPRVNMNAPDTIAAKISTLKHALGARSISAAPGGGVVGRCRVTGASLISKGSQAANLFVSEIAGHLSLGINGSGSAGLALPAGSLTSSFTLVAAINLNAADAAGTYPINFLSGFDPAGAYISGLLRANGAASSAFPSKIGSNTGTAGTWAFANSPAIGWAIVVVDYNNANRIMSVSVNQAAAFTTETMPSSYAPAVGSYIEVGYHIDAASIRNSKLGDLYTFSSSLLATSLGLQQLQSLVAAMKVEYGVS